MSTVQLCAFDASEAPYLRAETAFGRAENQGKEIGRIPQIEALSATIRRECTVKPHSRWSDCRLIFPTRYRTRKMWRLYFAMLTYFYFYFFPWRWVGGCGVGGGGGLNRAASSIDFAFPHTSLGHLGTIWKAFIIDPIHALLHCLEQLVSLKYCSLHALVFSNKALHRHIAQSAFTRVQQ